jgi:hypothetical protein
VYRPRVRAVAFQTRGRGLRLRNASLKPRPNHLWLGKESVRSSSGKRGRPKRASSHPWSRSSVKGAGFANTRAHGALLVQTQAMGAVLPPVPTYVALLSPIASRGRCSPHVGRDQRRQLRPRQGSRAVGLRARHARRRRDARLVGVRGAMRASSSSFAKSAPTQRSERPPAARPG